MFILPYTFILAFRRFKDLINVGTVCPYVLLNILGKGRRISGDLVVIIVRQYI